jgi:anti-sigma B factor antagonist
MLVSAHRHSSLRAGDRSTTGSAPATLKPPEDPDDSIPEARGGEVVSDTVRITSETRGPVVVLRVEEAQVLVDRAEAFRARMLAATPAVGGRLAVDLAKVEFLDSSGLGALVTVLKAVRPGGDVVLFGLRPSVLEILRLTHLDSVFSCQPDEAGALAFLTGAPLAR